MKTLEEKKEDFRKALKTFQRSKQNGKDLCNLMIAAAYATRMGDGGLLWSPDIMNVISEEWVDV